MHKITPEEFCKQVKEIEGFDIKLKDEANIILIDPYPYKNPCPNNWTVDEFLRKRIQPICEKAIRKFKIKI